MFTFYPPYHGIFFFFFKKKALFSSGSEWGNSSCGAWASPYSGFSLQSTGSRAWGFRSCDAWALEHRLKSCGTRALLLFGMWNLPGPGIEPESPALAGGLYPTESPGNPQSWNILDSRKKIPKGWH